MANSREECLKRVKENIREKHCLAWSLFFVSILLSFMSSFYIAFYTVNNYLAHGSCILYSYALALVLSTLCFGYISAFVFYYLHDYLPMANDILKDYQLAFAIEKSIYDGACSFERMILRNRMVDNNYEELLTEEIIESQTQNEKLVSINQVVWGFARLNKSLIEDGNKALILLHKEVMPMDFILQTKCLDIYTQLAQKNWALYGNDSREVEKKDLQLVLRNFKDSLEIIKSIVEKTEQYVYIKK